MRRLLKVAIAVHVALYRLSRGRVGGRMGGLPVLLLTTVGRRSGKRRTLPLLYLEQGEALAVPASNGGEPRDPAWFLNLRERPEVQVATGGRREQRRARIAGGAERDRLWREFVSRSPQYGGYEARTQRTIPVVLLERIEAKERGRPPGRPPSR